MKSLAFCNCTGACRFGRGWAANANQPVPQVGTIKLQQVTEDDVRRIIREELAKAAQKNV